MTRAHAPPIFNTLRFSFRAAGCRYDRRTLEVQEPDMSSRLKIGDHVTWNSEAGHVGGTIVKVHHRDFDYKGHTHHASADDPQYEIQSDSTEDRKSTRMNSSN